MKKFWITAGLIIFLAGAAWGQGTTYVWDGYNDDNPYGSYNWTESGTWLIDGVTATTYPGANPGTTDIAVFDKKISGAAYINIQYGITLGELKILADVQLAFRDWVSGFNDINITKLTLDAQLTANRDEGIDPDNNGKVYIQELDSSSNGGFTSNNCTIGLGDKNISTTNFVPLTIAPAMVTVQTGNFIASANHSITASDITVGGALNGSGNFSLFGNVTISATLGGTTALGSLSVTGPAVINANVTTSGVQTYNGTVLLGGGTRTLTGSTVNLGVITGGGNALTIAGNAVLAGGSGIGALQINGIGNTIVINGNITATASITINATGTARINAANITTTGTGTSQRYYGPVVLGANVTFTGGNANNATIRFDGTVNSDSNATPRELIIDTAILRFSESVGAVSPLASVTAGNTTGTHRLVRSVATTGNQTYNGPTAPGNNTYNTVTLRAGGTITFNSTLRSNNANARGLTVESGNLVFNGAVGANGNPISTLTVSGTGNTTFNAAVDYTTSITINNSGTVYFNNATVTTTGGTGVTQLYHGPVVLGANVNFTAGNNNRTVQFDSTINGNDNGRTLTLTTASAQFNGIIGGTTALGSVSVAGTSAINTTSIRTTGNQTYTGAVTLGANVNLTANSGNQISFGSTVNGAFGLTITIANVQFDGTVGDITALASVTVTAGTAAVNANITTSGAQSYGGITTLGGTGTRTFNSSGGSVTFSGTVSGTDITVNALQGITMDGANTLSGNVTLNNSQTGNVTDNVSFTNTSALVNLTAVNNSVNGNITVNQTGDLSITSAATPASGSINLTSSGNVTQTGAITTGTLTLAGNFDFMLNNSNNDIAALQTSALPTNLYPTKVIYSDTNAFSIGTGGLQTGTEITLNAGGAVNQLNNAAEPGAIKTGTFNITANGAITLNNPYNSVNNISFNHSVTGNVSYTNSNAGGLTVNASTSSIYSANNGRINIEEKTGDFTINGTISSNSLTLKAKGKITIDNNIVIQAVGITPGSEYELAAVYIDADELTGSGGITFITGINNWACALLTKSPTYSSNVNQRGIHYHPRDNIHIVYRSGIDDGSYAIPLGAYFYIQADNSNLDQNLEIPTSGTGNIYAIDVDDGNTLNPALTRKVNFSTGSGGHIEIRGKYTAETTGSITINSGTGGIVLIDADITLVGGFDTNGTPLTADGTANSINASGINLAGGIKGGTTAGDLSLDAANGIHITGGLPTPVPLGALNVSGGLTLQNTAISASSFTFSDGVITGGTVTLNAAAGNDILFNGTSSLAGTITINSFISAGTGGNIVFDKNASFSGNVTLNSHNGAITFNDGLSVYTGQSAALNSGGGAITFNDGNVILVGNVTLNSVGGGGGGEIKFESASSPITGGGNILITAGGGDVTVSRQAGASQTARIGKIEIISADKVTFSANVYSGDIEIGAADDVAFAAVYSGNISIETANDVTFGNSINTGNISIETANDITFGNSVNSGNISIETANDVTFGNSVSSANINIETANDVTFNSDVYSGDITINNNGDVAIMGQAGEASAPVGDIGITSEGDVTFSGDVYSRDVGIISAGAVTISGDIFAQAISIDNGEVYTQSGNVTLEGDFNQTGSGGVNLNGNITVTGNSVIGFTSTVNLLSDVTFTAFSGGIVELAGVENYSLAFSGGTGVSPLVIGQSGSMSIAFNSNFIVTANSRVGFAVNSALNQTDGRTLELRNGAFLDINAASWRMGGGSSRAGSFTGYNGELKTGNGSELIVNNFYLTGSSFTVSGNSDWATISVKGNVEIESVVNFTGSRSQLIIEMDGTGTQSLRTEQKLGSLHIKGNSHTIISSSASAVTFTGNVKISGILDAGNFDIIMQAGLSGKRNLTNYTHKGPNDIKYARWEIIGASIPQPPFETQPDMDNFAFRQNIGGKVSFQKDDDDTSGNPVFFEIVGNTLWREIECYAQGAVIQFSRHPDHHSVLEKFSIAGDEGVSAADHSKYVTITRLTEESSYENFPYIYDTSFMGPPPITTSAGGTANVGDLGSMALPVYYSPLDLKNADIEEQKKYWNINLVSFPDPAQRLLANFRYVRIFFSHAYNQRIPIETSFMHLDAIPYYRASTGEGYFNFDWVELRKILYSFTEDSSGDGRLDRIRVQTNVALNGDFSIFEVKVDGYEVDVSKGTNGFEMVSDFTKNNDDEDSFYINLRQLPLIDSGSTPLWSVTRNESLKDSVTETSSVGDPQIDINIRPFDTIPPRIAYTLALPGHPQVFVKMSEPVLSLAGSNISDAQAIEKSAAYIFTWQYFPYDSDPVVFNLPVISANTEYLLNMPSSVNVETLARLRNLSGDDTTIEKDGYFRMDNIVDQGKRAMDWNDPSVDPAFYIYYKPPKYPLDWAYTRYAKVSGNSHLRGNGFLTPDFSADTGVLEGTSPVNIADVFLPPYKMLTVDMMTKIAQGKGSEVRPDSFAGYTNSSSADSVVRRVTDVLISLAPYGGNPVNYFIWPVWARYSKLANPDNASLSNDFWNQRSTDSGLIWIFDGTAFLEARQIELQARMNDSITGNPEIFWLADMPSQYRLPQEDPIRGRSTGGMWLPYPVDLRGNNFLYYFLPRYSGAINQTSALTTNNSPLFNFALGAENNSGKKIEFIFRINNGGSSSDLFAARLDVPVGTAIPDNWYRLVRPFGFDVQDIRLQRGGVTILNNVINSDAKENAYIRYHLVRPGRVTLQVYTLDGTLVKSIRRGEYRDAGEWTDAWDGSNNSGRAVARGLYFVRVVAPDIDEIRKIMVVK